MRVALLSANPPTANRYIALLRDGVAAAGIDIDLLTEPGPGGLPAEAQGADILHLHWLELWDRPPYLNGANLARLGKPGRGLRRLLVPRLNAPGVYTWRRRRHLERFLRQLHAYKASGGRVVYTVHNVAPHEGEAAAVEEAGLRQLLQLADAVHVHSRHTAETLLTTWGEPDRFRIVVPERYGDESNLAPAHADASAHVPLAIIPHGNYVGAYPNQVTRGQARETLAVPAHAFIFLSLGLIRPYKGLEELLPAFASLQDRETTLLIAGQSRPPGYAAGLRPLAAAAGDDRIRWHVGFVPDDEVQVWMNAADIVVLPYRRITTSGAALLAFSFGRPVIAPALDSFSELMGDERALGLLYDPAEPDGLARALRHASTIDWRTRQPAILDWVSQFDWQRIGRQFATLYRQIAHS